MSRLANITWITASLLIGVSSQYIANGLSIALYNPARNLAASIDNSGMHVGDWIQVIIAFITLCAVLVALFQEKIKEWWNEARLRVIIDPTPPDSHKIQVVMETSSAIKISSDVIYVRIRVEHVRGDPANNVEVMLVRCWEYRGGKRQLKKNFLPLNLKWSHFQPPRSNIKVPAGLFRYCDLGSLSEYRGKTAFRFDTIVQPNAVGDDQTVPNLIMPGKYEIEVWVGGDNVKTVKKNWIIEIDGKWVENEAEMLEEHLKIREV